MIEITSGHLASQGLSETFQKRFWAKVNKLPHCWIWTANQTHDGYGRLRTGFGNHFILAHVASWIIHHGPIPVGKYVLHKCDNPPCVNPDHLWLGTKAENSEDATRKRRRPTRLNEYEVSVIRELACKGITQAKIARIFGCGQDHVSRIVRFEVRKYG